MPALIPIHHLASHARAGETLLLKLLSAHPRVCVPLQVERTESEVDKAFITEIRTSGLNALPENHPYAREKALTSEHIILVKQGIWHHRFPFSGLTLVRNPQSFVDSMLAYNVKEGLGGGIRRFGRKRYARTYTRLLRWSENMSQELCDQIERKRSVIDALCCFYNHRVRDLVDYGKPVFKYEDIVMGPEKQLRAICALLDIEFQNSMLHAHKGYDGAVEGHGMNDLSRPIDVTSLEKWRSGNRSVQRRVKHLTLHASRSLGYDYSEPYLAGL